MGLLVVALPAQQGCQWAYGRNAWRTGAGEEEMVSLTTEKVKWLLPPGVRGSADSSDESEEDSEEESSDEEEERPR